MGTRSRAAVREGENSGLTRSMRVALFSATGIVAVGLLVSAWLFFAAPPQPTPVSAAGLPSSEEMQTPGPGPVPNATPTTGSEVQSPAPTQTHLNRLPPLPETVPLISAPLPDDGSARGKLVAGFPVQVAGPAAESDVIDSSIAREKQVVQVALTARTDASVQDVRDHYGKLWADLRLAPGTAEGDSLSYADEYSSLTLAFASGSGTGTVYTVYGVLRAE